MKVTLNKLVLAGLSILCAGSSLAYAEGAAAGAPVASTPAHHAASHARMHAEKPRVVGSVVSLDVAGAKPGITVKTKSGSQTVFSVGTATKVYENGKTVTLQDIKAGQKVSVQEKTGASGQAESIHILGVEAA